MRVRIWAGWMLAAAPFLLSGCGNFWKAPSGSNSGCTTNCPTTASGAFYILNEGARQVAAYTVASGGTLTAVTNSPYTLSAAPLSLAISPGGGFLYVGTAAGIYVYSINTSTGALTLASTSGPISQDIANTMQVDPSGAWLVEAGPNIAEAFAIALDTSTGLQASDTEQHVTLPADTVQQLKVSPDGSYMFVALGSSGTAAVPFNASNTNPFGTTVTRIPVKHTNGSALSVAVDPSSTPRLFYVGETLANSSSNGGGLRVFNYSSLASKLTEVSGSPYSTGNLAPSSILADPTGTYLYATVGNGTNAGTVAGFSITSTGTTTVTYSLSSVGAANVGVTPAGIAEDNTNTYVMVVSSGGSPDLAVFSFDSTTAGKLDSVLTSSTGNDPVQAVAIAAAP